MNKMNPYFDAIIEKYFIIIFVASVYLYVEKLILHIQYIPIYIQTYNFAI